MARALLRLGISAVPPARLDSANWNKINQVARLKARIGPMTILLDIRARICDYVFAFVALVKPLDSLKGLQV
ncbi:MAG TPA: hypothetical protein VLY23_03695 [Candidatus Acidoferrum sp.]|nr:hypothetical protein [Candidatus Acidoferrum sp.]